MTILKSFLLFSVLFLASCSTHSVNNETKCKHGFKKLLVINTTLNGKQCLIFCDSLLHDNLLYDGKYYNCTGEGFKDDPIVFLLDNKEIKLYF